MHCEGYQRTMRSLRHRNLCEAFIRLDIMFIIDWHAQSPFFLWGVLLRAIGFIKSWKLHLLLRASTSAVLIVMCTSLLWYCGQELTIRQQQGRRWRCCILLHWSSCVSQSFEVCLRDTYLWEIRCLQHWTRASKEHDVHDSQRLPRNQWYL